MAKRQDLKIIPLTIEWQGKTNRKYFLDYLIKKFNLSIMAEVGVRDGRTTFYLLDKNPNLKIFAIDKEIHGFYNETIKQKYGDRLVPIRAYSDIGSQQLLDNSCDIIFIDADHSYKWVKSDIKNYLPKLNKHGWLTGHDIDYPGVNKAVTECIHNFEVGPNNIWIKKPYGIKSIIDET